MIASDLQRCRHFCSIYSGLRSITHKSYSSYSVTNTVFTKFKSNIRRENVFSLRSYIASLKQNKANFVHEDTLLFKNDSKGFIIAAQFFCASQFLFWGYLSYVSFTQMQDSPLTEEEKAIEKQSKNQTFLTRNMISFVRKLNVGQYKYGIAIFSASLTSASVLLGILLTKNYVRFVMLKEGGKEVVCGFFSLLGRKKQATFLLDDISAKNSRHRAPSFVYLKVRQKVLHLMLDAKGHFPNGELFDRTIGLRRSWK